MRLIDADALEESLKNSCKDTYETKMFVDFMDYVDESPTIEQSEDCISRQQLLEALDTWDKFGYVPQYGLMRISKDDKAYIPYIHYDDAVDCIKALSSVTPSYNSINIELKPCEDVLDEIITQIEQMRDKDKIAEYPYNRCIRIVEGYKNGE